MAFLYYQTTPVGRIGIREENGALTHISFACVPVDGENIKTALIEQAFSQLDEYFAGQRKVFDLPLNPKGTDFQKRVWLELRRIPYGETRSYQQIAESAGNKKACRAVGMANNKNPLAIVVPCHRVIGSSGRLVGYAGGLEIKKRLLNLEGL